MMKITLTLALAAGLLAAVAPANAADLPSAPVVGSLLDDSTTDTLAVSGLAEDVAGDCVRIARGQGCAFANVDGSAANSGVGRLF